MNFQLHIQREYVSGSRRVLYLDGTCEQVTIMGKTGGEGRSVKESEGFFAGIELLRGAEGVNFLPEC